MKYFLQKLPKLLVCLRFVIAWGLLFDALDGRTGFAFVFWFTVAFLSDIFDGIIARRMGVSTDSLRKADSFTDLILYICVGISAWLCHKELFKGFETAFCILVALQVISWLISLIKFQKLTSYHSYLAKAWGITLFLVTISIFAFAYSGWFLALMMGAGVISILEDIAITFILPVCMVDVLSINKAFQIKKSWLNEKNNR